jgi:hypothetical protein
MPPRALLVGKLLGEALRALAKRVEGGALFADRRAGAALAQLLAGTAHGLAGLAELAVRLHAHALHLPISS